MSAIEFVSTLPYLQMIRNVSDTLIPYRQTFSKERPSPLLLEPKQLEVMDGTVEPAHLMRSHRDVDACPIVDNLREGTKECSSPPPACKYLPYIADWL